MSIVHPAVTASLLGQPETGMGWQLVEVYIDKRVMGRVFVLNGETLVESVDGGALFVGERRSFDERTQLRAALATPATGLHVHALTYREARQVGLLTQRRYAARGRPASEGHSAHSEPDERFLRFSAFKNDRRINQDGSVLAGTYTTTYSDGMEHIETGMDAVRRYALPNPDPAVHRFYLRPPDPIHVRRGTVQPANGQPGGGVDVIFEDGAPAGTKYKQDEIPPGNENH